MKVIERVMEVTSTLEGEKIGMTINTDALAHIMAVLTDLYSDPELAVIREYSTNAFDAHVEAGVTRPIEVTLPSPLSPFFTVRDFGFGLDVEDIREIYSQYGASTKRDNNDVVGMLGLGCKSALTYSDQFTLTAIKDGICVQVSISRDEDGSGSMTIVDEYETTEPSGVEVTIPTKRNHDFEAKSAHFFRFWTEGTVLVNGQAPKRIGSSEGLWISDDLLLTPEADTSYVVMGNVAYPMPDDRRVWNQWPTVAFVEIGSVQFTPSRESLQMTALTTATLDAVKKRVKDEKDAAYQSLVENAPDRATALKLALAANKIDFKGALAYQGQVIPDAFRSEKDDQRPIVVERVKRYRNRGWNRDYIIPSSIWGKTVWIEGYDGADFSAHKRKKIDQWLTKQADLQAMGFTSYALVDKVPADIKLWVDPKMIHNWSGPDAEKIKIERKTVGGRGRISGSYSAYVDSEYKWQIEANDIDTSKPIFFVDYKYVDNKDLEILSKLNPKGHTVVTLGLNRVNKFKRDFPKALLLRDYLAEKSQAWMDALTEQQRLTIYLVTSRPGNVDMLRKLNAEMVEDAELKAAILAANVKDSKLTDNYFRFSRYGRMAPVTWTNPLDNNYPLLTNLRPYDIIGGKMTDHIYLYLNAVHSATKEA